MTFGRLLLRNLLYHWRGNSAVLLGVAVGTAVLTGALLVGDSLRGSLHDLTLEQLGWVDRALVTGRFLREAIASDLSAERVAPAILLRGTASTVPDASEPGNSRRSVRSIRQITIFGVDDRFWAESLAPDSRAFWNSSKDEVVLNGTLAAELGVSSGDLIALSVQKVSAIPRETLLGRREASEVVDELRLTVRGVLPREGLGQFSLNPSAAPPRNAFVPLRLLQTKLGQEKRVNALLVAGAAEGLQEELRRHLTLDDWGLVLHDPQSRMQSLFAKLDRNRDGQLTRSERRRRVAETFAEAVDRDHDGALTRAEVSQFYREQRGYLSLESRQMLLEPAVAEVALATAKAVELRAAPTLVYLANSISGGREATIPSPSGPIHQLQDEQGQPAPEIPYAVVAALDPALPPPLGPFLPAGVNHLQDSEIVLADWEESPLRLRPGDAVWLGYLVPEKNSSVSATFRFRGVVPLQGPAADPDLTPEFPGITDKLDIRDWNPPFPFDNKRIQKRDEQYWEEYRTTPKAYVTLATGQRLWGSRFGELTSIRLAPADGNDLAQSAEEFRAHLLAHLQPEQGGLVFDAVRERGLEASAGFTDFGGLFLGFSFFLIAAALLLVGLLFRLNLDRRAAEIGLLLATGYRRSTVRRLLLAEGSALAALGGLLGSVGAVAYAWLLLQLLTAWWPGALDRSFLRLHATGLSIGLGYAASVLVSFVTIAWAIRVLGRVSLPALLAGETQAATDVDRVRKPIRWSLWAVVGAGVGAAACVVLGGAAPDQEMRAMTFFGSGALLLTTCLAGLWLWLRRERQAQRVAHGGWAVARLGIRNAARHPLRSLLTAGLLAAATFLVVAVESFHREPGRDFLDLHSGSGGFMLLAEADLPLFQDLNVPSGREALNFPEGIQDLLQGVHVFALRLRAGDDASCLNLYQPRRPRLLGVPDQLVQRGGFHFHALDRSLPGGHVLPWMLLYAPQPDGAIPVFGEANTVQWMLKSGLGQVLEVPNERGEPVRLRIVGLLKDSIFQSELLMSEANFLKLYPRQEGYQFFLIAAPPERMDQVRTLLETTLADHGFAVTPTARRLEAYLAVENTYLATFQALGGLGLLLGALGLAVVLLRSVWERRGELALLRALGYRHAVLGWLLLAENGFLLLLGLAIGAAAALLAVAPHLLADAGEVPLLRLMALLGLVLLAGLAAAAAAVAATLRAPLLPALRRE
ncbi:MAG: FtsX-like permease family protein [Gemmataceae bacterium]|nr:FtsX-like permease family protein [Gemmataceae bacterium]